MGGQTIYPVCNSVGNFILRFHHQPVSSSLQSNYLIELDEIFCLVDDRGCDNGLESAPDIEDGKVVWKFRAEISPYDQMI